MYPLRFEPMFRRYIWGGRRLCDVLSKEIGSETAAESWEVVDHQDDQSVVQYGDLAGKTLRQLIADSGVDLIGQKLVDQISAPDLPAALRNRFPLLLKFLDANRALSVQVHPDDRFGATLDPPDLGKTEAWYVMHADPGAKIYAGLRQGVTKEQFRAAVSKGATESVLHSFEPCQGECVFIPAGTMHAIGEGLLIAEIQQASNTTFRVYDWGRVGADGQPRPLHIEQAIEATDFSRGPIIPETPQPVPGSLWMTIVSCEKFVMNRGELTNPQTMEGGGRFKILAVTRGEVSIEGDPSGRPLGLGETVLVPACWGNLQLIPSDSGVELLEISVPD